MKTFAVAAMVFIASANAALAADVSPVITPGPFAPPPAFPSAPTVSPGIFASPPAYPQRPVYNWTGFYVGINGGGDFGSTYWQSVPDTTTGTSHLSGGLVGGTVGYNLQAGDPFVVSVEADLDWAGLRATASPASCAPGCELKVPWLGTTRLRFGYAFDWIMPFVTGGAAYGDLDADIVGAPLGRALTTNIGWTAGGGVEVALTDALRAKVEYLYVDLDGFSCNAPCGGGPISFNFKTNVIRAGLNYRFWTNYWRN
jgi:outer membrane immunogenic protein